MIGKFTKILLVAATLVMLLVLSTESEVSREFYIQKIDSFGYLTDVQAHQATQEGEVGGGVRLQGVWHKRGNSLNRLVIHTTGENDGDGHKKNSTAVLCGNSPEDLCKLPEGGAGSWHVDLQPEVLNDCLAGYADCHVRIAGQSADFEELFHFEMSYKIETMRGGKILNDEYDDAFEKVYKEHIATLSLNVLICFMCLALVGLFAWKRRCSFFALLCQILVLAASATQIYAGSIDVQI